jgi:hypothetical protein
MSVLLQIAEVFGHDTSVPMAEKLAPKSLLPLSGTLMHEERQA